MNQIRLIRSNSFVLHFRQGTIYSIVLALLPVVMMYKVPLIGIGVSTVLIVASMLYAVLLLIPNMEKIKWRFVFPLLLYCMWTIIRSDGSYSEIIGQIAIVVHIATISCGIIDINAFKKTVVLVSCLASVAVLMQLFAHTLFDVHIPLINPNLCLDYIKEDYFSALTTGFGQENAYRPSAFFLEPSHFATYAIIGLAICITKKKIDWKKAALITAGMIFTTSGIGMVLTVGIWGWYIIQRNLVGSLSKRLKNLLISVVIFLVVAVFLYQIPTVRYTISRFTGSIEYSSDSYNAIWGRTLYWDQYIKPMELKDKILGLGLGSLPDVYFTGLMEMIYCYGYIGVALFYHILIKFFKKKMHIVTFLSLALGAMMIIANLSSFIMLIYYFSALYVLYAEIASDSKGSVTT